MNSASQSTSSPGRSVEEARALLGELDQLHRRSRLLMSATWFPLLIGGIVTLAGVPASMLLEDTALAGTYWLFGVTVILASCVAFYGTRRIQVPDRLAAVVTAAGLGTIACSFALVALTDDRWQGVSPLLVGGVGLGVIAFAYRSTVMAAVSAVYLFTGTLLAILQPDDAYVVGALVTGTASCLFGVIGVLQTLAALEEPLPTVASEQA
jgi:hypothetical protein